jgi:hypothetical protein
MFFVEMKLWCFLLLGLERVRIFVKGAGNIEYGDIENWEIKKNGDIENETTGISREKQRQYRN